jgi:glutathione S-transferase
MRLIGSVTSPYVRFVRATLAEPGVEHEFTATGSFGKMSPEDERRFVEANPLMTLSTLLVNGGYRQC